jgi:DNA adenine methylase
VIRKVDGRDTFHYVDPPYFNADMGHYGGYTQDDFVKLLKTLSGLNGKFMLSSYPSDVLCEYAKQYGWNMMEFKLSRSAGGGVKTEVLTVNYDLPSVTELYA